MVWYNHDFSLDSTSYILDNNRFKILEASEQENKYVKFKFYKSESISNIWCGKMPFLGFQTIQPPSPSPSEHPEFAPCPLLYVLIALIIVAIVAVKYRAFLDFLFIFLSMLTGFVIGLLWHSPISMGFAMMCAVAGILVSITIDI